MPMRLSAMLFQSLMSSPLRTSRQSLPDPRPATPTRDFAPWPSASEMSCGPNAVSWRSPETSAVRASEKRWNITISIWMLYLAASSGSSQSGDSAGTLSMPCLILSGCGNGARRSACASASPAARAATQASIRLRRTFMTISPIGAYQFPQWLDDSHRLFAPQRAAWAPADNWHRHAGCTQTLPLKSAISGCRACTIAYFSVTPGDSNAPSHHRRRREALL